MTLIFCTLLIFKEAQAHIKLSSQLFVVVNFADIWWICRRSILVTEVAICILMASKATMFG